MVGLPQLGSRIVVAGNLETYAQAFVIDHVYVAEGDRTAIILEWPNAPGGPGRSRVWDTDEGNGWYRYAGMN